MERFVGPVIAALIVVAATMYGWFKTRALDREYEQRRRREKELDMVFAIHAEILAGGHTTQEQTTEAESAYLIENGFPFGPSDRTDFVFDSLKSDLSILPQQVIHSVVRYYRKAEQSNLLVDYLQNPLYEKQTSQEKAKYARQILEVLRDQQQAARAALGDLETFIEMSGAKVPDMTTLSNERLDGTDHNGSPHVEHCPNISKNSGNS
ncbi:MAG: hypothetical protein KAG89_10575 [Fulvimarina manganoxydans]|uniref:hypothetical protein n=1 Tax=Fulvimarina manganoxydans TaxID=937218 RepID=UPI0023528A25|nr:hypothetical protein [Fulvimarina manganoxydans]MCK5932601.1 hypothetical protein [Fulvimarina manganoxydans]